MQPESCPKSGFGWGVMKKEQAPGLPGILLVLLENT